MGIKLYIVARSKEYAAVGRGCVTLSRDEAWQRYYENDDDDAPMNIYSYDLVIGPLDLEEVT